MTSILVCRTGRRPSSVETNPGMSGDVGTLWIGQALPESAASSDRVTARRCPFAWELVASAAFFVVFVAAVGCGRAGSSASIVTVDDVGFEVEVAHTPTERAKGLSDRESLAPMAGMLFVFETGRASAFWMRGMEFALDFVWIGEGCAVVDTTVDVSSPAPGTLDSELPFYQAAVPAAYALEVNAGEVERLGILAGDQVRFSGISVKGADC